MFAIEFFKKLNSKEKFNKLSPFFSQSIERLLASAQRKRFVKRAAIGGLTIATTVLATRIAYLWYTGDKRSALDILRNQVAAKDVSAVTAKVREYLPNIAKYFDGLKRFGFGK